MSDILDKIDEMIANEPIETTSMIEVKMTEKEFSAFRNLIDWCFGSDSLYNDDFEFGTMICRVGNALERVSEQN